MNVLFCSSLYRLTVDIARVSSDNMFDMIIVVVVVLLMMLMLLLLPLLLLLLLFFAVNDDVGVTCFCYKAEQLKHFPLEKVTAFI